MSGQLPKRVGESGHALVTPEKVQGFAKLELSQNTDWADMAEENTLFTPAILYLAVPLTQDPFDAFQQDTGIVIEPRQLVAETGIPLFCGLTLSTSFDWNYQVLCAPKEQVAKLHDWLRTVKYLDSSRGLLWQPQIQRILIRDDPSSWSQNPDGGLICRRVLVDAWTLNTSRGKIFYGQPDVQDFRYVVPCRFNTEVDAELVKFRDQLVSGVNPYLNKENP